MQVEYTGRQIEITPAVRKQVEEGLRKIGKVLGSNFNTHVILTAEKYRHIAEITITIRDHTIVGLAESSQITPAIHEALDRIDCQAIKYKDRWRTRKRQPRQKPSEAAGAIRRSVKRSSKANGKGMLSPADQDQRIVAVGPDFATAIPVVVHSFPNSVRMTEAHVVRSQDSVAHHPMTLEEAIKEAEFRDRDVFVFRDTKGNLKILHRKKDGKIELIEAP